MATDLLALTPAAPSAARRRLVRRRLARWKERLATLAVVGPLLAAPFLFWALVAYAIWSWS